MKKLPKLKIGDTVEIIAPASRCTDHQLDLIKNLLTSWGLKYNAPNDIFGNDVLCANTDELRFQHLKNAILNPDSKAIICARGGYGSMRLIPELAKLPVPKQVKSFVGMSDTTALQLFFQNHWSWPSIHGAIAPDRFSEESVAAVKTILFGDVNEVTFSNLTPLNSAAKKQAVINAEITGGNLCLVQTSLGTNWQIDSEEKIILLEEVGERGYRIDRMLEQLNQAGIFKNAKAILLGDFTKGNEPDGTSLVEPVLDRFATTCDIPILRIPNVGHESINFPIPLGTTTKLQLGDNPILTCEI